MIDTSLSLLGRAGTGDAAAWERIDALYRPLVRGWLARRGIASHEADDLTQDVLLAVSQALDRFHHPGAVGSFRGWLRAITANRAREFWRAGRVRAAAGGDVFLRAVEELADPASGLALAWDREHDEVVLGRLLDELEGEVAPQTMAAFRLTVFDGRSGAEVAAELDMSVAAVYAAKSRVLARLRAEAAELLD